MLNPKLAHLLTVDALVPTPHSLYHLGTTTKKTTKIKIPLFHWRLFLLFPLDVSNHLLLLLPPILLPSTTTQIPPQLIQHFGRILLYFHLSPHLFLLFFIHIFHHAGHYHHHSHRYQHEDDHGIAEKDSGGEVWTAFIVERSREGSECEWVRNGSYLW